MWNFDPVCVYRLRRVLEASSSRLAWPLCSGKIDVTDRHFVVESFHLWQGTTAVFHASNSCWRRGGCGRALTDIVFLNPYREMVRRPESVPLGLVSVDAKIGASNSVETGEIAAVLDRR
jgi:hypothetical protein